MVFEDVMRCFGCGFWFFGIWIWRRGVGMGVVVVKRMVLDSKF